MKRLAFFGMIAVSVGVVAIAACNTGEPAASTADADGTTGAVTLALTGQGNLGNPYQLTGATFNLTGPVTMTISGDPDTVTQSLPVGVYTISLQSGWTLKKVSDAGASNVTATLASANPQQFVINGNQTTTVSWVFNVSGADPNQDDLEVVTVNNGSAALSVSSAEVGWANIATGNAMSCGITIPGLLKCWGANANGQLGYGDMTSRNTPAATTVAVGAGRTVKRAAVARDGLSACALLDDNTVKCWGYNTYGQLGYGDATTRTSPPDPVINLGSSNTAKTIAMGSYFACAILDSNAVKCWGNNSYGQLGVGDTANRSTPPATAITLGAGSAAKSIELGTSHACALLSTGAVRCWGYNSYGQLGNGTSTGQYSPDTTTQVALGTGRTAKYIAAGDSHTCALLDDNTVKCWGYNGSGQLGYGDVTSRNTPDSTVVNLGSGHTAKRIAAGSAHTCAILEDDTIKCWGSNSYGQLGYEDTNQRSAPASLAVNVGTGRVPQRIVAGYYHTCVELTDNSMKCWGYNNGGQFGTGPITGTSADYRGDQINEMGDYMPEVLP